MKYSDEQKERAVKKLAKAYGEWNHPGEKDRAARSYKLGKAVHSIILKFGMFGAYQAAIQAEDRRQK